MRRLGRMLGTALLSLCLTPGLAPGAAGSGAAGDSEQALERIIRLQQTLLELDREQPEAGAAERLAVLAPLVQETHDLERMGRLAVARHWNELEAAQRDRFLDLFAQLSAASYAERFRDLAGQRFEQRGMRLLRADRIEIRSALVSAEGDSVDFIYVLLRDPAAGWRIINVLVNGVSELSLQRSDYQRILSEGGFADLEEFMKNRSDLID